MNRYVFGTLTLILFVSLSTQVVLGQKPKSDTNPNTNDLEKTLMALQRQEDEAEAKKDIKTLDQIMDDDVIITVGRVITKAEFLAGIRDSKSNGQSGLDKYDDVRVRDLGNTAIVNYRANFRSKDANGKEEISKFRITVVWRKKGNNWRQAAVHANYEQ